MFPKLPLRGRSEPNQLCFQHPQSDRCSRNRFKRRFSRRRPELSASSIGSMFPKRGRGTSPACRTRRAFSILNRIDVPETWEAADQKACARVFQHPQSDRCSRNRALRSIRIRPISAFSILNRIDVPETSIG